MLRNREIRIILALVAFISTAGAAACFYISVAAGIIASIAFLMVILAFLLFTRWRYRQIHLLSGYLRRIAGGDYSLDVRDNQEGELSILKNEIYKVTVTLSEQASLLKKDKQFLADSLSDISHQLKTPITSMSVMAELLQNENLPQDKRAEFVRNIHSQLERLKWLVSSLLKLSRIDAGTIEFKKERIRVRELVSRAVEPILIPMELKEQTLEITGDEDAEITGDSNWTAEALANIVKNCMEHTPAGGRITIAFSENSLYTDITISDNGEGIHKQDLPHIFKRFYKGKNAHQDSIGIGLAMSRSIIENQNGTIEVSSEKGKGTTFTVKFYKGVV
ncbi:MAG TPA: HAMP domain-containing sensor histidine kinase [Thermoclostridium caenicola]|nr:HAMP domain-containing sensor histidine kinase [Thermoclostridium caenicola]